MLQIMKKVISDIGDRLRENEYKLTKRREMILKVLLENSDKHLSAEEVYNLVGQRLRTLDWLRYTGPWAFS